MHKLRWHPLLEQWVVFTTVRQNRPQMPANWCPFDPGSGQVPENYDVYLYANDYPAFKPDGASFVPNAAPDLFAENEPSGACDVVLYSPQHALPPSGLTIANWRKVIDVWTRRTSEHSANPDIALVEVFENCGEAVGVTMPHPHGQIYATPFLSPTVEKEVESLRKYARAHHGACLFCDLLAEEIYAKSRIVAQNKDFVAFIPFAARFPGETAIYSRTHSRSLLDLDDSERDSLAEMISIMRRKYDNLYNVLMPMMMGVKQGPFVDTLVPYHLHVQFLPLMRGPNKLKFLASMETVHGVFLADTAPEDMAIRLRESEPQSDSL